MLKKILVAAASSMFALSVFAGNEYQMEKCVELKDGSTVHLFKGGEMGMESKLGHAISMEPGQVMETKDGKTIVMNGNEVSRVDEWLIENYLTQID